MDCVQLEIFCEFDLLTNQSNLIELIKLNRTNPVVLIVLGNQTQSNSVHVTLVRQLEDWVSGTATKTSYQTQNYVTGL